MSEIELKFLIDEPTAKAIWARAKAAGIVSANPRARTLRSVYLDTPGHALKGAGIALRLRRDGRRWVQTVKMGRALHGGLSRADELECPAPGGRLRLNAIPDERMRAEVVSRLNGAIPVPVCETEIRRMAGELRLDDGTRAELAVDAGDIRAEGRSQRLHEAEIELIAGSPAGLFDIARLLFPEGGLRFSRLSKAARGYLLASEGVIEPPLAPRNALTVPVAADATAELAARDVLRECLDQIAANMTAVAGLDDPEGPHQLRVGLRRLRSAFSVFAPVLRSPASARLKEEARWLGQAVGKVRDLDVMATDMARREAKTHADEPALAALADALDARAASARTALRATIAGERAQAFLLDLARFVETRGWLVPEEIDQSARLAAPVTALAERALAKCWKKARRHAETLDTLEPEERHELRKELKRLRYAVEFLAPLYPEKRVGPFLKRLKKLQDVFGELNDAELVQTMFAASSPLADAGPERAQGWLAGAAQARAEIGWTGAKALWRELEGTRRFWK